MVWMAQTGDLTDRVDTDRRSRLQCLSGIGADFFYTSLSMWL